MQKLAGVHPHDPTHRLSTEAMAELLKSLRKVAGL